MRKLIKSRNKAVGLLVMLLSIFCIQTLCSPLASAALPKSDKKCNEYFLTIPAWFNGMAKGAECDVISPGDYGIKLEDYILQIVVNITSILFNAFAYICVIYIAYGGYQILIGGSNPDSIKKGRATIFNGIIGLVIGFGAPPIVNSINDVVVASKNSINDLFLNSLSFASVAAAWTTVLVIILAGIGYLTGGGNPDSIQKARKKLTYAIIGLVIVGTSLAIYNFVNTTLKTVGQPVVSEDDTETPEPGELSVQFKLNTYGIRIKCGYQPTAKFVLRTELGAYAGADADKATKSETPEITKCTSIKKEGKKVSVYMKKIIIFNQKELKFSNLQSGKYKLCLKTVTEGEEICDDVFDFKASEGKIVRFTGRTPQLIVPSNWATFCSSSQTTKITIEVYETRDCRRTSGHLIIPIGEIIQL